MPTREQRKYAKACTEARVFNDQYPSGTLVRFWPGMREDAPRRSVTRGRAWALLSGQAIVRVDGYPGGIALSHIEVVHEPSDRCVKCGGPDGFHDPACVIHPMDHQPTERVLLMHPSDGHVEGETCLDCKPKDRDS